MKALITFFTLLISLYSFGQKTIDPNNFEDKILALKTTIDQSNEDDFKVSKSQEIVELLTDFYQNKEAFEYSFSKIKSIGFIDSPDRLIKIVNWNIERQDHTNQYFGVIIRHDTKSKKYIVYPLIDQSEPFEEINTEYYTNDNWYGALYYKIIPTKIKNKEIYTLLGYDANNKSSQLKMIDAITFTSKKVKFGHPFFQTAKKRPLKRVLFEYSKKSYMALKYEDKIDRIIFDHLSPEDPSMVDFRQFYIPDMSYDAFDFENEKWNLKTDIIAINPKKESETYQTYGINKDGEMIATEKKNKWIDPTDKNAPGGANIHTITLPEENKKKIKKEKKSYNEIEKISRAKKKDNTLTPYEVILKNKNKKRKRN